LLALKLKIFCSEANELCETLGAEVNSTVLEVLGFRQCASEIVVGQFGYWV